MSNAAKTATKTIARHRLIKSGAQWPQLPSHTNHLAAVIFTVLADDTVRIYTYATWTDYTSVDVQSREAAREAWKELRADGWEHDKDWALAA